MMEYVWPCCRKCITVKVNFEVIYAQATPSVAAASRSKCKTLSSFFNSMSGKQYHIHRTLKNCA